MNFKDKIAVVTGAGKGIGRAIAIKLAINKATVFILDLNEKAGKETENDIKLLGEKAVYIKTDITNYQSILLAKSEILNRVKTVDFLIINAGISVKRSIREISIDEWDSVLKINLSGSFYTLKAFYDIFESKRVEDKGKIVFITSGSAITGTGGGAHYAASKSGQHGLMRAVSKELGKNGVNVNAIAPRVIITDIFEKLYPTEALKKELLNKIPIGRFGNPKDIANMVNFLVSEDASYIHGQIMLVDGGRTY